MSEIKVPLKAIRAKCLDCCCGQANEVKLCPSANAGRKRSFGHEIEECAGKAEGASMNQIFIGIDPGKSGGNEHYALCF